MHVFVICFFDLLRRFFIANVISHIDRTNSNAQIGINIRPDFYQSTNEQRQKKMTNNERWVIAEKTKFINKSISAMLSEFLIPIWSCCFAFVSFCFSHQPYIDFIFKLQTVPLCFNISGEKTLKNFLLFRTSKRLYTFHKGFLHSHAIHIYMCTVYTVRIYSSQTQAITHTCARIHSLTHAQSISIEHIDIIYLHLLPFRSRHLCFAFIYIYLYPSWFSVCCVSWLTFSTYYKYRRKTY